MMSSSKEKDTAPMLDLGSNDESYSAGQTVAQCSQMVRKGFIRKVYGILTVQLLATAMMCALAMKSTSSEKVGGYSVLSFGSLLAGSAGLRIFIFVISIVCLLALFCMKDKYPTNMMLLAFWTIAMSVSVATSCSFAMCDPMVTLGSAKDPVPFSIAKAEDPNTRGIVRLYQGGYTCAVGTAKADDGANAVVMAAMITATIFFSLTAFTLQSKIDFSFLGAGLGVSLLILCLFGFGMMIFGATPSLYYGYCVGGTIIFALYIIFDTWMIHNRLGPDDYIMAAIDLYLDIINLFIMILQLLNRRD